MTWIPSQINGIELIFGRISKITEEIRMTWSEEIKWNLTLPPKLVFYVESFLTLPAQKCDLATENPWSGGRDKWISTKICLNRRKRHGRDKMESEEIKWNSIKFCGFLPEEIDHLKMEFD